ncbi:MAG: DNA translocase FtsK 4TM domain-containing protein [Anaerolineaceae bacterium]|nr:DNA translocase FtsK 4TM domain-containing protein [Anaerolineaceae bacterium]
MARKTSTKKKSKRTSSRKPARKRSIPASRHLKKISKERKTDIIGVLFLISGIVALLGFWGRSDGNITGWIVMFLSWIAGMGAIMFPFVILLVGFWLIFRNEKRFPMPSIERLLGIILLYINMLAWMHWLSGGGWSLAESGGGGGYIGAVFERLLVVALGDWGAFVVLLAWVLIALAFTFDVSIPDLFRNITQKLVKTGKLVKSQTNKVSKINWRASSGKVKESMHLSENREQLDGFTPIQEKKIRMPFNNKPVSEVFSGNTRQKKIGLPDGVSIERVYHSAENSIKWKLPKLDEILNPISKGIIRDNLDQERAKIIEETLASFNAPGHVVEIHRGPTFTQFGIEPDFIETRKGKMRVRINKITSLTDDLALAMAAPRIRVQAPVPGRKYIGIEVPNAEAELVTLREGMQSKSFQRSKAFLRLVLGKDVAGKPVAVDLGTMPHLLIAGTTGSGKSVCINAILCCLLMNRTPNQLRFVMVDPKRVELTGYNGIPHLLTPVIVETEKVIGTLKWMSREMDSRYKKFSEVGARNIDDFNSRQPNKLPYIVVVIDELADLMMMAPEETERHLNRLAQLARATGIHVIIATQRPSVDVITGMIKANFPARISFKVVSNTDSRVILDQPGAERLIGLGDMLFQAPDAPAPKRLQGVFVANNEIQKLVNYWKQQAQILLPNLKNQSDENLRPVMPNATLTQTPLFDEMPEPEEDPLLKKAIEIIRKEERASISMLQRKLAVGYTRAARMIDRLEELEIIGKPEPGLGVRPVLDFGDEEK